MEGVEERVLTVIQNDLLPHADRADEGGNRETKIRELLKKEDWSHLPEEDRNSLFNLVTRHNEVFILYKRELGKIQGPPAHLNIANPSPVRLYIIVTATRRRHGHHC